MKRMLLLFAMTITTIAGSVVAKGQIPTPDAQTPFRFELAQADGPRGLGVMGYVYNGLPVANYQCWVASRRRRRERDGDRVRLGVGRG
jgi:hypothetical protein